MVEMTQRPDEVHLPVAEKLANELLSIHPYTRVSERFVRQQAMAMCKVVNAARHIRDFRTGT